MYIHSTGTSVLLQNHNSLLIRPDQPCNACESQLPAVYAPAEQPPSSHQSPYMTDHPGEACHVQTATATSKLPSLCMYVLCMYMFEHCMYSTLGFIP